MEVNNQVSTLCDNNFAQQFATLTTVPYYYTFGYNCNTVYGYTYVSIGKAM